MAKKKSTRRKPVAAIVRTDAGAEFEIQDIPALQEMAVRWSYVIRNRAFWKPEERAAIRVKLREELKAFKYRKVDFRALGQCRYVEVEIPFKEESQNWAARIFPWEFVLTNAMEGETAGEIPIVGRWLHCPRMKKTPRRAKTNNDPVAAFVKSAPGDLAQLFDFDPEQASIFRSLDRWRHDQLVLTNPTLAQLRESLRTNQAELVHVTAVDLHQGAELLRRRDVRFRDGFYLAKEGRPNEEWPVEAVDAAGALAGEGYRPRLVGLNMYHSAPRIAPLTIAGGAESVIGFQDVVDDALAELFFAEFYRNFASDYRTNVREVFEETLRGLMRGGISLDGAGLVLWSRNSLLPKKATPRAAFAPARRPPLTKELIGGENLRDLIKVEIDPHEGLSLNYSLLHNGGSLFKRLYVVNHTECRIDDLRVRMNLFLNDRSFDNTTTLAILGPGEDLRPHLPLPLLGLELRRFRESVLTNLKFTIEWQQQVIVDLNLAIRLLPINEWCDTDQDRQWLPSFVQPLDPALRPILKSAEQHLRAITDDPSAGFDGYQQVDPDDADSTEIVDQQVRAIWTALLHDHVLAYVNPPPSYTDLSQRIRSPSEVFEGRRGTCIDLAVLLASCLEYVEIYPTLILLKDHAFPAYWRSEQARDDFLGSTEEAMADSMATDRAGRFQLQGKLDDRDRKYAWMVKNSGYTRVVKAVNAGDLVPLESVWMTNRKSFAEAQETGRENLEIKRDFECLLDIAKAREEGVLPLPERD